MPDRRGSSRWAPSWTAAIVGSVEAGLELFGNGEVGRLELRVEPTSRRKGVGTELYRLGIEHIRTLGVKRVTSSFFESDDGRRLRERARLDASTGPRSSRRSTRAPSPSRPTRRSSSSRPAHLYPRDLHRIDEEATRDMPAAESIQAIPYDEWLEFVWHNPLFTSDGSFGAVIDGRVAAVSLLLANFEWGRAVSMFTGTSREHRGRGLARAVKLASIRWAAGNGITQLVTTNDETNASMLAVNGRLGYTPTGRRVEYLLEGERLTGERGEDL